MPFFTPAHYAPEADLFSILSALSEDTPKSCQPVRRQAPAQTYTPRFDVAETATSYELYGELPGLAESDLSIEFSDAQTILIKGKVERVTPTSNSVANSATPEANTPGLESDAHSDAGSERSLHATVEDEYDAADAPLATPTSTAAVSTTEKVEKPAEKKEEEKKKYWVAERKVGTFARSFSFSQRVEIDEVQASLRNGLLRVVVPKSQKAKKVAVQIQ